MKIGVLNSKLLLKKKTMKTFNIEIKTNLSNPVPLLENIKEYIKSFTAISSVKYEEVDKDTFTIEEYEELKRKINKMRENNS